MLSSLSRELRYLPLICAAVAAALFTGCASQPNLLSSLIDLSEQRRTTLESVRSLEPDGFCEARFEAGVVVVQEFDDLGRIVRRVTTPQSGFETEHLFEHNSLDDGGREVVTKTTQGQTIETVRFDSMDREVYHEVGWSDRTTTTWDDFGNVVELHEVRQPMPDRITTTEFSLDGSRPSRQTGPEPGQETTWTYNNAGFEAGMFVTVDDTPTRTRTWTFDGQGSPTGVSDTEFTLGPEGSLQTRVIREASLVFEGTNLVSEEATVAGVMVRSTYEYDDLGRIIAETKRVPEGAWQAAWVYTSTGDLESFRSDGDYGDDVRLEYDGEGRLVRFDTNIPGADRSWNYNCR